MKNLQSIPEYTVVDSIDNNPNVTGRYEGDTNKLLITKGAPEHVKTHELNHYLNTGGAGDYMRTIHGEIAKNELLPQSQVQGVYKDKYDYFSNPDEVHSRIMVLREKVGIKPNETVTPEKLKGFMKTYKGDVDNINDLLNMSKGEEGLLNMLNFMAKGKSSTPTTAQNGLMTGKDYYEQWMNSPMYKQMLETSVQGPELERISQGRTKSYSLPYSVVPTNFEDPTVGGERRYRVRTPLTATSKELEEMTSALRYAAANPKDKDAVRKAKQIMEPTITGWDVLINKQFKPGTARYESTLAHELGHLTDAPFVPGKLSASDLKKFDTRDYIPASDKEKIKKYTENKTLDEYNKYLSNPKETRQFLNELRYVGKTQGIYDPFTEKITVDKFRKISGDQSPSKDALLHLYSEDEIVDMLNSISKAPQEGIPTAQNGQEMSFYQQGLDWTPRNISRNGGWLDKFEEGGEVVKDNEGYWNPQNWGKPVEINSNKITMEGVLEPLLGVSDTGDTQMMYPGKNYTFNGTKVVEYPREHFRAKDGKSVNRADEYPLEKLDNLLNFTNYNKPKAKNGWLEKYK
jgi:hypothetical protein